MIVGIDEVGRGCWAGPLVAGAVVLSSPIKGLKDSKKLSRIQRERLDAEIRIQAVAVGIGWVQPKEIDKLGLSKSVKLAMQRALDQIDAPYDEVIIDGNINFLSHLPKTKSIIKADDLIQEVSAASIVAKVARDKYMHQASLLYPGYGFEKHVGYGTKMHQLALGDLGICVLHRTSFKPISKLNT